MPTEVINEADGVVSTEDKPIISSGLGVDLSCHNCEWVGPLEDCGRWIPGGHGKWCEFECPECGARLAKEKGTNRYVEEDLWGLPIADAFGAKFDEDADRLLPGSEVDPSEVGESVTEVVIFYPDQGTFERFDISADDVFTDGDELRKAGMAYSAPSLLSDEIPAVVVFENSSKPIGYDPEWDEDDEDFAPGAANKSVLRFVREA